MKVKVEVKRIPGLSWLSYLLYALLLIGVLLYVRFPTAKVEKYLTARIATAIPGTSLSFGTLSYVFPATMRFDRVMISREKGGEEIALLENVGISPVTSGFGLQYALAGDVYGGTFHLRLKLAPFSGVFTLDDLGITTVALDRAPFIQSVFQREIGGALTFSGTCSGPLNGMGDSSLEGVAAVRGGGFALRQPIMSLQRMNIETMDVRVSYGKGVLKLLDGSLKGAEQHLDFSGDIQTAGAVEAWELQLNGSMVPQKDYMNANPQVLRVVKRLQRQFRKNDIPYTVSGSIGNPRFRFGNK